ncbi:transposase, partial [Klebsiella pneumoniae]|uniref:transposase n=1 Tax=Klebsiella pneumoniae TaxID=573 RepID=UPI0020CC3EDA
MTGILLGQEVRKRRTPQEKIAIIQQTMEPGMNVSHVARLHGIQPRLDWPYISIHFLSLNPLLVRRRRYSRGERYPSALCG